MVIIMNASNKFWWVRRTIHFFKKWYLQYQQCFYVYRQFTSVFCMCVDLRQTKYSRMDQVKFMESSLSNFEVIWSAITSNILEAVFQKFYLVHFSVICSTWCRHKIFETTTVLIQYKLFQNVDICSNTFQTLHFTIQR